MARLYAAGYNAVGVVDDGKVQTVLDGRGAQCLAVDPKDPDTLYVGTSDEGLFRSTDGGGSWEKLSGIEHPRVTAVAVGAKTSGRRARLAGDERDGVDSVLNPPNEDIAGGAVGTWRAYQDLVVPVAAALPTGVLQSRLERRCSRRAGLPGPWDLTVR